MRSLEVYGDGGRCTVGIRWLPRLRIDRRNGSFVRASWALTVAAVGWGAWKARHGMGADMPGYFVCLASIAISFLLATFESPVEHAVISIIFAGFPVMAVASFAVPPDAGYLGQILRFCFTAIAAAIAAASLGAKAMRKDGVDKDKVFSQLFLWQLGIVLVFLVALSLASPLPSDSQRRLSKGLTVTTVKVDAFRLSLPFVLGDKCYVVSQHGSLAEIDMNEGKITAEMGLPAPKPADLGLEGHAFSRGAGFFDQALFYGDPPRTVQLAYPYPVEIEKDGKKVADWSNYIWVDLTLPMPSKYPGVEWRLGEEPADEAISLRDPGRDVNVLKFGDCSVDRTPGSDPSSRYEIKIATPDKETSFNLDGDWNWAVVVGEDRVIISTFFGHVYIISRER